MADITPIASLNGELAMPEKVWMQGPPGPQGQQGEPGAAATVTVGTVTTGEPGTDAIVTNSGTESAAVLNFTIPRGATGAAGATGPQGQKGDKGDPGPAGAGVPDGGTVGQLLGKTESGPAWIDPPQSGVQPDWNQNDATQPDYVKNRPFYTGNPVETVLVEESTVSFSDAGDGIYQGKFASTFSPTIGETYKVSWDGTVYECECVSAKGARVIGNASLVGAVSDSGEPFVMIVPGRGEIIIGSTEASNSHTFSISCVIVSSVVKIDGKYLPDTVATKSEVEVAQTTANAAQTTANSALPKTGGAVSGNLTVDAKNDSYRTVISAGEMALQYVNSAGTATDMVVISGRNTPSIVAGKDGSSGFNLSKSGLSLGYTSKNNDGIHLYHENGSSIAGEIVIQHTNIGNDAKERISIASTGRITCNNRLKFDCGSEIEVVQTYGKTGGSAIILRSSTADSTKRFRITVDDTGTLTATEVT